MYSYWFYYLNNMVFIYNKNIFLKQLNKYKKNFSLFFKLNLIIMIIYFGIIFVIYLNSINKKARNKSGPLWSRGESNPCPNKATIGLLHAYCFIICRQFSGKTQTKKPLS